LKMKSSNKFWKFYRGLTMSDFVGKEKIIPMPPVSIRQLNAVAQAFLAEYMPAHLERPGRLDVLHLIDDILPRLNIHTQPGRVETMGQNEGITLTDGDGEINILIEEDQYDSLEHEDGRSHRGRSTALHEVSHAILHVPYIRRLKKFIPGRLSADQRTHRDFPGHS